MTRTLAAALVMTAALWGRAVAQDDQAAAPAAESVTWTIEEILPLTCSQAWQKSGKSVPDFVKILVAEGVVRRIADAAHLEPLDPHGRADGDGVTGPCRLLRVDPEPAPDAVGTPALIDRDEERARVRAAFDRATSERVGVLVRVTGKQGVGTSRLAEECLAEPA